MILYFDTSSLVKLYVEESHSDQVKEWVKKASIIATCRIAYPEAILVLNRRLRAGDPPEKDYHTLKSKLSVEWENYAAIDFDELEAGRMVEKHGLRGFDAVHLSAIKLLISTQNNISFTFSTFDVRLARVAVSEGFSMAK